MAGLIPAWWGSAKPGTPYRPSNGTEGECFFAAWCCKCERDASMRSGRSIDECDDDEKCELILKSFVGEPLPEWIHDDRGYPMCTAFVPAGESIPKSRCLSTVDMFNPAATTPTGGH